MGTGTSSGKLGSLGNIRVVENGEEKEYRNYDSLFASDDRLKPEEERWWNSLPEEMKRFVKDYTDDFYREFNKKARAARGVPEKMGDFLGSYYIIVNHFLGKYELPENIVMHRNTSPSFLGLPKNATIADFQKMVGKTVVDYSVMSAKAANFGKSRTFFGRIQYNIKTPKGTGIGAYLANHSSTGIGENEFLYRPGSSFRVDGVRENRNGNIIVDMTYRGNIHNGKRL